MEGFVEVTKAFATPDEDVISWRGENYYKGCDIHVRDLPDGGQSFCVKRVNHPGNLHEDFDGAIKVDFPIVGKSELEGPTETELTELMNRGDLVGLISLVLSIDTNARNWGYAHGRASLGVTQP